MGVPKYTLPLRRPTATQDLGRPLLLHLILCHHHFQSSTLRQAPTNVVISVRDEVQREDISRLLTSCMLPDDLSLDFVVDDLEEAGPASGLLAAYQFDKNSRWLVTGCDYPLVEHAAFRQLFEAHESKHGLVTCFINLQGFSEPLLAIWTSSALHVLEQMMLVAQSNSRKLGPNQVVRTLEKWPAFKHTAQEDDPAPGACYVKPENALWIRNINTPQEWTEIQPCLGMAD